MWIATCPRAQEIWTISGTSGPRSENTGSERSLEIQSLSWKAAVHDQRSAGDSLRSEKLVKATDKTVRVGHARLETVCTIHAGTQRRVAIPDGARQTSKADGVATIEVCTDADWAGDAKSMKSTSSVFTRIDAFIIGMNAKLQDTHAQSSGESEFYALGAGCADGLYVKAILNDLGLRPKINLRCDAKAARALAQRQGLSKRTCKISSKREKSKCRELRQKRIWQTSGRNTCQVTDWNSSRSLMGKRSDNAMTFRADTAE